MPQIVYYYTKATKVSRNRLCALILLGNAPAHPLSSELIAEHSHMCVNFLPANTTSLLQSTDQGIAVSLKKLYHRRFLEEVIESKEDQDVGKHSHKFEKKHNPFSVLHNISRAWYDIPKSTLANGQNYLLHSTEPVVDFGSFEATDFHCQFLKAKENSTEDVQDCLECDEGDPGQQILTENDIAVVVLHPDGDKIVMMTMMTTMTI